MTKYQAAQIVKEGAVLKFPTTIPQNEWMEAKQMAENALLTMPLYEAAILELLGKFDLCPIAKNGDKETTAWCEEHCGEGKPNLECCRRWMKARAENREKYYESHKEKYGTTTKGVFFDEWLTKDEEK